MEYSKMSLRHHPEIKITSSLRPHMWLVFTDQFSVLPCIFIQY